MRSAKLTNKPIHAGFPNAADEAVYNQLNLHKLLIKRPSSTFFMRLDGSLHSESYIPSQTILVVDREPKIRSGDILVVDYRGEMVVKIYKKVNGCNWLLSLSGRENPIELKDDEDVTVWGVVLHFIESTRGIESDIER